MTNTKRDLGETRTKRIHKPFMNWRAELQEAEVAASLPPQEKDQCSLLFPGAKTTPTCSLILHDSEFLL
jgi:hypothetical protein